MARLPRVACGMPENVCCSCMGNCGEGSTIPDWPMLMSPTLRIELCSVGGGPTTPALGVIIPRRKETALASGGGATTEP